MKLKDIPNLEYILELLSCGQIVIAGTDGIENRAAAAQEELKYVKLRINEFEDVKEKVNKQLLEACDTLMKARTTAKLTENVAVQLLAQAGVWRGQARRDSETMLSAIDTIAEELGDAFTPTMVARAKVYADLCLVCGVTDEKAMEVAVTVSAAEDADEARLEEEGRREAEEFVAAMVKEKVEKLITPGTPTMDRPVMFKPVMDSRVRKDHKGFFTLDKEVKTKGFVGRMLGERATKATKLIKAKLAEHIRAHGVVDIAAIDRIEEEHDDRREVHVYTVILRDGSRLPTLEFSHDSLFM